MPGPAGDGPNPPNQLTESAAGAGSGLVQQVLCRPGSTDNKALPGVVPACWRAHEAARARDFCYDFAPGERIGIVGRNGTGKVPHGRRAAAARIGRLRMRRPAQCSFASTCTVVCELLNREQPGSEPKRAASHGFFPIDPGSMHLEGWPCCSSLQYGCNAEVLWSLCQWEGSRAWLQIQARF